MKKYQLSFPTTKSLQDFLKETDRPEFRKDFSARTLFADLKSKEVTLERGELL